MPIPNCNLRMRELFRCHNPSARATGAGHSAILVQSELVRRSRRRRRGDRNQLPHRMLVENAKRM